MTFGGEECPFREHPVVTYLGKFYPPDIIACPGCGRLDLGPPRFHELVAQLSEEVRALRRPLRVAIMGCEVNGPGRHGGAGGHRGSRPNAIRTVAGGGSVRGGGRGEGET